MRSFIAAALTLAGAAVAATSADGAKFQLRVTDNANLNAWALVNAHAAAGTNSVQIQRPAAYQSDVSHLDAGALVFDLKGATIPYSLRIPAVPEGSVVHVTSELGGGTKGFLVNADNYLTFNGGIEGFYACPVNNVFELYYGPNAEKANLPSTECQAISLGASFV